MEMQTTVGTPIFAIIVHKNQSKLMGLVHAMRSNGPLPQVLERPVYILIHQTYISPFKICLLSEFFSTFTMED